MCVKCVVGRLAAGTEWHDAAVVDVEVRQVRIAGDLRDFAQ